MSLVPYTYALTSLIFLGSAFITKVEGGAAHVPEATQPFTHNLDGPLPLNSTCTAGSYAFDTHNTTLGVYCNTDKVTDFAYDWTFIDVNLCIGNNDGALTPSPE